MIWSILKKVLNFRNNLVVQKFEFNNIDLKCANFLLITLMHFEAEKPILPQSLPPFDNRDQ